MCPICSNGTSPVRFVSKKELKQHNESKHSSKGKGGKGKKKPSKKAQKSKVFSTKQPNPVPVELEEYGMDVKYKATRGKVVQSGKGKGKMPSEPPIYDKLYEFDQFTSPTGLDTDTDSSVQYFSSDKDYSDESQPLDQYFFLENPSGEEFKEPMDLELENKSEKDLQLELFDVDFFKPSTENLDLGEFDELLAKPSEPMFELRSKPSDTLFETSNPMFLERLEEILPGNESEKIFPDLKKKIMRFDSSDFSTYTPILFHDNVRLFQNQKWEQKKKTLTKNINFKEIFEKFIYDPTFFDSSETGISVQQPKNDKSNEEADHHERNFAFPKRHRSFGNLMNISDVLEKSSNNAEEQQEENPTFHSDIVIDSSEDSDKPDIEIVHHRKEKKIKRGSRARSSSATSFQYDVEEKVGVPKRFRLEEVSEAKNNEDEKQNLPPPPTTSNVHNDEILILHPQTDSHIKFELQIREDFSVVGGRRRRRSGIVDDLRVTLRGPLGGPFIPHPEPLYISNDCIECSTQKMHPVSFDIYTVSIPLAALGLGVYLVRVEFGNAALISQRTANLKGPTLSAKSSPHRRASVSSSYHMIKEKCKDIIFEDGFSPLAFQMVQSGVQWLTQSPPAFEVVENPIECDKIIVSRTELYDSFALGGRYSPKISRKDSGTSSRKKSIHNYEHFKHGKEQAFRWWLYENQKPKSYEFEGQVAIGTFWDRFVPMGRIGSVFTLHSESTWFGKTTKVKLSIKSIEKQLHGGQPHSTDGFLAFGDNKLIKLSSVTTIMVGKIGGFEQLQTSKDVPEYSFGF